MSSKKNPIEEIYKCSILTRRKGVDGGVPKCIFVFYGASDDINASVGETETEMS